MTLLPALWAGAATLATPALRLNLLARARRGKEVTARLAERRGRDPTPRPAGRLLWLHAASVGETVSVLPVLSALARQAPDATLLVTTGTVTSAALLAQRLPALRLQGRVLHRFAPLDVPAWARRFLRHWRPDAAAFVESELWPNLLAACRQAAVPMLLLNARLSAGSAARWRRAPGFARRVLGSFDRVLAQSTADAARFEALGARHVEAEGDLKFAAAPLPVEAAELDRLRRVLGDRPRWLAASTHAGEEAIAIAAHRRLAPAHPGLLTVLAPRHPERGAAVAALAGGVKVARRALGQAPPAGGVWIADTLGELGLLYRLCGIVLVGRSLLPPGGGQNPLEPARLGCAIAIGPHTGNFADAVATLEQAGGLARVADAASLAGWIDALLGAPARRAAMAAAAGAVCDRHADLPERAAAALLALLRPG